MSDSPAALIERLYACFNRRDEAGIVELCDERMRFFPVVTAEAVGRDAPYSGRAGLCDYLADVAEAWEELQITPGEIESRGQRVLVQGRVYARSRERGIRDVPVGWIWEVHEGRFIRGEVFPDPVQAAQRFAAASP